MPVSQALVLVVLPAEDTSTTVTAPISIKQNPDRSFLIMLVGSQTTFRQVKLESDHGKTVMLFDCLPTC